MKRIGAKFEHYRVVEFDKYAVASYNAVHGTDFPPLDITKIHASDLGIGDTDAFTYLLTYSFPCTDLSVAGKQAGMSKGSGTRSGLLWEVERILSEIKDSDGELPQILFMENVPQVHGKKNIDDFHKWIEFLDNLGYTNFWKDLNAKDYGVAQNRNRCFMFSFLGNYTYKFPEPIPLEKKLKDYLEDDVDDRYYINNEKAEKLIKQLIDNGTLPKHNLDRQTDRQTCIDGTIKEPKQREIANCIRAKDYGISTQSQTGNLVAESNEMGFIEKGTGKHQSNTIYSENGCSPCLNSVNYKDPLKVLSDTSMSGLEGGAVRTYKDTAPSITAREYKDPRMIMEQANGKID